MKVNKMTQRQKFDALKNAKKNCPGSKYERALVASLWAGKGKYGRISPGNPTK